MGQCNNCRLAVACQDGHIATIGWDGDGRDVSEIRKCSCMCHYWDKNEDTDS